LSPMNVCKNVKEDKALENWEEEKYGWAANSPGLPARDHRRGSR
jgi:hypothetical protein